MLDTGLAQHAAKAADLCGITRRAWLVAGHAAEKLPDDVLAPALNQRFVAQVERVLEVQQRDHQAQRNAWAPGVAQPCTGQRRGRAKQINVFDNAARAVLASEKRCDGGFDVSPGQSRRQHDKRVAHVDHRIQARAKEVVGGHSSHSQKLPGAGGHRNRSREIALLALTPPS